MRLALSFAFALTLAAAARAETASSIEGVVEVTGRTPAPAQLVRAADPFCAKTPMEDPSLLVHGGKLQNVWVHVTAGAEAIVAAPPKTPVEVAQKNCMYEPRVTTAVVGQHLVARNDDPTLHNVHTYVGASTKFNKGMPNQRTPPVDTLATEEGLMKWKCDVHPWMRGYVGITKNGLSAVTGEKGSFRIENVPPGTYTVEAWHEKLGIRSAQVTVEKGKPARVVFKYTGAEKSGL